MSAYSMGISLIASVLEDEGETGGGGDGERGDSRPPQLSTLNSQPSTFPPKLSTLNSKLLPLFTLLAFITPAVAQQPANLNIAEIQWGFDGTVMKERFSPLTLIVDNPTGEVFDGQLRLYRADFGGRRLGGFLVAPVYLAPGTRRIVQFYPYIISDMEHWHLEWDGGAMELPPPQIGGPARVILVDDETLYNRGGAVKRLSERFFPSYTTATDGLGEVVLDHAPDWDKPRRQAFLDWLRQGGTLHLLNSPSDKPPVFGGELQRLNEPSDRFYIGGGLVRRHPISRLQLTPDYVRTQLDAPAAEDTTENELLEDYQSRLQRQQAYGATYRMPLEQWSFHQRIFEDLKKVVSPDHDWGMIHLLSLAYVVVLFPGCFLIGREYRNAPLTLGLILGATALFGGAFYLVGNRGYGESTSVHGVALARHIEGERFDVMEWSNLFVTNGGYYGLSHSGSERLYSDATNTEAVGGMITAGSNGRFLVDIPPFSSRVMAHKAVVTIPGSGPLEVVREGSSQGLRFQLPAGFPRTIKSSYVLIGDEGMRATLKQGKLVPGAKQPIVKMFHIEGQRYGFGFAGDETDKPDLTDDRLIRDLIVYSLGVSTDEEFKNYSVPEGIAWVFIYAPRPESLALLATEGEEPGAAAPPESFGIQEGYVLYWFDVPL